jgi:hypothetical protein
MVLFKRHLLQLVLQGRKTQTRRIHRYELTPGRIYPVKASYCEWPRGHIRITQKWKQRLGDISEPEARAEGFTSIEDFQRAWAAIYGSWNPDLVVVAYQFELVQGGNSESPREGETAYHVANMTGCRKKAERQGSFLVCSCGYKEFA